jgi:hypothetical protein
MGMMMSNEMTLWTRLYIGFLWVCCATLWVFGGIIVGLIGIVVCFFLPLIAPLTLTNRLLQLILNKVADPEIREQFNHMKWREAKRQFPLKRVWRFTFHFKDDLNCWIECTYQDKNVRINRSESMVNDVQYMFQGILNKKTFSGMFWECWKLERQKKGTLIYVRENH